VCNGRGTTRREELSKAGKANDYSRTGTQCLTFVHHRHQVVVVVLDFAFGMQQSGSFNPSIPFLISGQAMSFPGQPVLDQAIVTLQELSAGNVQFLNAISSALLKWATVFQRVASDVSERFVFQCNIEI
jgi:hypothetical protein